jgi:hypothetical protein
MAGVNTTDPSGNYKRIIHDGETPKLSTGREAAPSINEYTEFDVATGDTPRIAELKRKVEGVPQRIRAWYGHTFHSG